MICQAKNIKYLFNSNREKAIFPFCKQHLKRMSSLLGRIPNSLAGIGLGCWVVTLQQPAGIGCFQWLGTGIVRLAGMSFGG